MGEWQGVDTAGRKIAGLLGYTPPAGFYSRMQRAVEAMPEVIQTREIPGLLRKYPEGVPKWEISTVDVPGIVGDRKTIGRQELLDAVQQRSPVFTHREVVLKGPGGHSQGAHAGEASRLGLGQHSQNSADAGAAKYFDYGHGDDGYQEILLMQPGAHGDAIRHTEIGAGNFISHWAPDYREAVAHARTSRHGDATRINEIQSDLGIHNRQADAFLKTTGGYPQPRPGEHIDDYRERIEDLGLDANWSDSLQSIPVRKPFPLEDAWADLLVRRVALAAAREGTPFIEVASPLAVKRAVGGDISKYRHFYGKVIPGLIERLGAQSGGVQRLRTPYADVASMKETAGHSLSSSYRAERELLNALRDLRGPPDFSLGPDEYTDSMAAMAIRRAASGDTAGVIDTVARYLAANSGSYPDATASKIAAESNLPWLVRLAENDNTATQAANRTGREYFAVQKEMDQNPDAYGAGVRYRMSPEMIRNLLERGVPASVLGAAALQRGDE